MNQHAISRSQSDGTTAPQWLLGFLCCTWMLLVVGCGPSGDRRSLSGTVTLDGQPLAEGSIAFRPEYETDSPTGGGKIQDGKFAIKSDAGLHVGSFRVEITASRPTGQKTYDEMGNEIDEWAQYLPERYNSQSELTAEVTDGGPNEFDFPLETGSN